MDNSLNGGIGQAIVAQRSELARIIVDRQWELDPLLTARYGESGHAKCVQDVGYNLSFLAEAITSASPTLFRDYIAWVKVLFTGLNIPTEDLAVSLQITGTILRDNLPPDMGAVAAEYIEVGLKRLQESPDTLPSFIEAERPFNSLAQQYLEALLKAERHTANRLILDAVEAGTSVKNIYLHVFQPTQYEIGRLWQTNQISVAEEHYCTAVTQMIMSQLYPYIFATKKNGRRLVATCVGNELHEIGIRMVTDFFEMEGWDTYYLGANVPTDSILRAVTERQANILAISVTMTFHISAVKSLIDRVRTGTTGQNIKIMVGGYPFNVASNLWQQVNADGYAHDAETAVSVAAALADGV